MLSLPTIRKVKRMYSKRKAGCWIMVLNATFNNSSVISRRSVLLTEETEYPVKTTDLSQNHRLLSHIMLYRVQLAMDGFQTHNFSGDIHRLHM